MTIAGKSCGVMPIAIASANNDSARSVKQRIADEKMTTVRITVIRTSSSEKLRSPSSNAVCGGRCESLCAIEPIAAERQVATTTPLATPFLTTVPKYEQH